MRDFVEEMARAGEELVGFGASFDGARFAAAGAVGDFSGGDGGQEMTQAAEGLAGGWGAPDDPGPGLQAIDGAFEAGACGVAAAAGDETAQEIAGDHVEEEFALDHGGAFGAQALHLQGGLEASKKSSTRQRRA